MPQLTPAQTINAVAPYQGVIEWKGQPSQGVSQQTGNSWANVDFVLKYLNHNMREELILFTLSGPDKVNELMALPLGAQVKVWWRPTCRSWQDAQGQVKWFGQNAAFSVTQVQPEAQPQQPAPAQSPVPQQQMQQPVYQQAPAPQPTYQQAAPAPQPTPAAPAPQAGYADLPF